MNKKRLILPLLICGVLFSCTSGGNSETKTYVVNFELNKPTDITTTAVSNAQVKGGELVTKPVVIVTSDNPNNYLIESWYEDQSFSADKIWDFDVYRVDKNLTLYAKWSKMFSIDFYLQGDNTTPLYTSYIKPGNYANPCDDQVVGYRVDGYYTDSTFSKEFDFKTPINENTKIYVKSNKLVYFSAQTLNRNFSCFASSIVTGSTAGNISLINSKDGDKDVEAIKANFGYSPGKEGHSDPYIGLTKANIDARHSQVINIKMKNLGPSKQIGFYWVGVDSSGNYISKSEFNSDCCIYHDFTSTEMNMDKDDDFITVSFELSKSNKCWRDTAFIKQIRIESNYASTSPNDLSNEFIINEITSVNIPEYDVTSPQVSIFCGKSKISSFGVAIGSKVTESQVKGFALGKKVTGFYSDFECSVPFDFNTEINENTNVYITCTDDKLYFSGEAIAANFTVEPSGNYKPESYDPIKGKVLFDEEQQAADVDFGISPSADPKLLLSDVNFDVEGIKKIKIGVKNLGECKKLDMFWCGTDKNGSTLTDKGGYGLGTFGEGQTSMKLEDEFVEITIDVSSVLDLKNFKTITSFRIDASYICSPEQYIDKPNRMIIKYIEGE